MGLGNNDQKGGGRDQKLEKSYFEVMGLCCTSEVPLIEKILRPLPGVKEISVVVPSKTVIVVHDSLLVSQDQIVKALNHAKLEANLRVKGQTKLAKTLPNKYVIACGILFALSFLRFAYHPFKWLAVAAAAVGIWPVLLRAVAAVRNLTIDVSILVLVAAAGTLALGDYWEAGFMVFVFTIAEWLESMASHKATAVMSSLMSMAPQQAIIAETGESVNVEDVKLNTMIAVKAGDTVPIDGIVIDGNCEVDEKTLTGESFPVSKQKDSIVWAGTINLNGNEKLLLSPGYITVKTTAYADECVVARMAKLVEEAQGKKSRTQRFIDECAKYYTPAVLIVSAGLAAVPAAMRVHNLDHWLHLALVVLVSACPCGLILSTPVAIFCALSKAATSGLLIKGGDYLELLAKIKVVAFDKTGTITSGDFVLSEFKSHTDDIDTNTLLYWVSSIESKSSHPIAAAIVNYGRSLAVDPKPEIVEEFQNFPGEGISGKIEGRAIFIGNLKIGRRAGCVNARDVVGDVTEKGRTFGYIFSDAALVGILSLSDSCRSGAKDAINDLRSMGKKTAMLTGDSLAAANHTQDQLGDALDEIHAGLLPEQKAAIIQGYKNKVGPTAMIGDGVNDAPALATADVGISMGISGSALAKETGHVVLMSTDIRNIPKAICLAKRCIRKVIENVIISMATKVAVLALAFAGHPLVWLAVLADVGTCLAVTFNSMLLLRGTTEHAHKCHPSSHAGHTHEHKKCCSGSGHSTKATSKQCCSKKTALEACVSKGSDHCQSQPNDSSTCGSKGGIHGHSKPCCPASSLSSEASKECCSKTEAVKACDNTASKLEQCSSNKKCCSAVSDHCGSEKAAEKTCDPSAGAHCHLELSDENTWISKQCVTTKKCCFSCSDSSEVPELCPEEAASSTATKTRELMEATSEHCCSKKTTKDTCDPSAGDHCHLELADDNTWKSRECVIESQQKGDPKCTGECHREDKMNHNEIEAANNLQALGCCHGPKNGVTQVSELLDGVDGTEPCCHHGNPMPSLGFSLREVRSCCRSFREECCSFHGRHISGFGGQLIRDCNRVSLSRIGTLRNLVLC
ncbi:Cadmium/zinc-transporting ATPase HMA2-like protein [Drosera capensis]